MARRRGSSELRRAEERVRTVERGNTRQTAGLQIIGAFVLSILERGEVLHY